MALHFVALLFSVCSLVLFIIANIGTTFTSSFLPHMYLVQINQAVTGRYIRYGVYNSCLYYAEKTTCTTKMPGYTLDTHQFAELCGADMNNVSSISIYTNVVNNAHMVTFQGIVLIMPALVLVFIAFFCTLLIRRFRETNVIPFIGGLTALFGFFCGAAGLALTIATFWKALDSLEKAIEGLSHQWGPSIYLVGIGSGSILVTFVCFIIRLFTYNREEYKQESFHLKDNDTSRKSTTMTKDEYTYDIPTLHYPSYQQQQQAYHHNYHQNYY